MSDRRRSETKEGARIAELGGGLVLRHARRADVGAVVAFNGDVHRPYGMVESDRYIEDWTRDLFERPHPTFAVPDFMVVEDTATGSVVSSLNLISQTWSYGGVPFGVGRIELVGTHREYRRRGLVRRQFEVVHRWSAERGELVQGITGIYWYYRQFGYEYALQMPGGRAVARGDVPPAPAAEAEPFQVRAATPADAPFLAALDAEAGRRYLVTCVRDEALWRYEINGRSERDGARAFVFVIEDAAGTPVGCVVHEGRLHDGGLTLGTYELAAGTSWRAVTPSVLRHLSRVGEEYARHRAGERSDAIRFRLGDEHPAYGWLTSPHGYDVPPSDWYIRVADLPSFLRRIAPILEARLADAGAVHHSGDVLFNFYRSGLRLSFERGRLVAVEPWEPVPPLADASFPELTFLKVLFGYRSLDELHDAFPDCFVRDRQSAALVYALFPKRPSLIWPVS
ncbi:MAG: GNAT family N-acetyltransferase [Chloroflexota bacterium]|nr:GNAT family N-acetyltransferase [Chloroflexota bacterium]